MKKIYNICGIYTECDFRFPTMTARSEKYLSDGLPEIIVSFSQEKINDLRQTEPTLDDDNCEIISTTESFYMQLLNHGGFMLHSSAVVMDNAAYLFSAPSGTGKSTHTQLWLKAFGERAEILNDDKPAIMLNGDVITACGTPWSGKSDMNINRCVPLRGICFLERSPENFIQRIPPEKSLFSLLDQTLRPDNAEQMTLLLDMLDKLVSEIPVWRMGCNISEAAARTSYNAMSGT